MWNDNYFPPKIRTRQRCSLFFFFFEMLFLLSVLFKKLIYLFSLEDNYFTILWWLSPYLDMNQPWVYMCPLILNPSPTPLPTLSLWVVWEHQLWVPCFMRWSLLTLNKFSTAKYSYRSESRNGKLKYKDWKEGKFLYLYIIWLCDDCMQNVLSNLPKIITKNKFNKLSG